MRSPESILTALILFLYLDTFLAAFSVSNVSINNIESFEPKIGFKTQFKVKSEDRTFTHLWTITEVEPLKKIVYNWKYEEYAGDSFVYFELFQ